MLCYIYYVYNVADLKSVPTENNGDEDVWQDPKKIIQKPAATLKPYLNTKKIQFLASISKRNDTRATPATIKTNQF